MCAFIEKLELWFHRVQRGNTVYFSNLAVALEKNKVELYALLTQNRSLSAIIKTRIFFKKYFRDSANTDLPE